VHFGWVGKVFRDPNREDLPSVPEAEKLFGAAGVDPVGKEVIIYTRKGDPFAYYGVHAMKYYGAKQAKVYHGGIDDWKAAGKPVTKEVTKLPPVAVQLAAQDSMVLWNKDMLERVRTGGAQILDVRTPREYAGDDIRAVRGGHVPGAVNIPPRAELAGSPDSGQAHEQSLRAVVAGLCGDAHRPGRKRGVRERRRAE
jgi:thiosulfate/3-mercaptopyruvate sulfurtransferase